MENIIIVIGLLLVGLFGFFVIKNMDHLTTERKKKRERISVAFDSSTLIRGMERKMKGFEDAKENPELFWYAGTQEEVMGMLQGDSVEFAVCSDPVLAESHPEYHMAKLQLNPDGAPSEYRDMEIIPAKMDPVTVTILWKKKHLTKTMHSFLLAAGAEGIPEK